MESSDRLRPSGKLLRRQLSSRLQMHAPASIQIAPSSSRVSEWKVAIPLLSPLDISAIPAVPEPQAPRAGEKHQNKRAAQGEKRPARWSAWQHPAAPFYYESVPSNTPVFALPHCA